MATIAIRKPFVSVADRSKIGKLVPESALQTFDYGTFVQRPLAGGTYSVAPASPVDGSLLTGLAFTLEKGHNFATAGEGKNIEVAEVDVEFEINLKGNALTQAQLSIGAKYGLSIDAPSGHYVLDVAKTTHTVAEITRLAARGRFPSGSPVGANDGGIGDDNVRVVARLLRSANA